MGDARKTNAISLEEFLEAEVRISHSPCVQQVLGAKNTIPSQALFCNPEGNENRKKKTSRKGVREVTHAAGKSAGMSRRDLVRPVSSSPISPVVRRSRKGGLIGDLDEYRKAQGGGEIADSGGRTDSETSVAG